MTKTIRMLAIAAIAGLASAAYTPATKAADAPKTEDYYERDLGGLVEKGYDKFCFFNEKKTGDYALIPLFYGKILILKCEFHDLSRTWKYDVSYGFPCFIKKPYFRAFTSESRFVDYGFGKGKLTCIFKKHDDKQHDY